MADRIDTVLNTILGKTPSGYNTVPVPLDPTTPTRKYGYHTRESIDAKYDKHGGTPRYVNYKQRKLLEKVADYDYDNRLVNYCAMFPNFQYVKFWSEEEQEYIQGVMLMCKRPDMSKEHPFGCTMESPNKRCKFCFDRDNKAPEIKPIVKTAQTILRKAK
jgi:hypothetical protein